MSADRHNSETATAAALAVSAQEFIGPGSARVVLSRAQRVGLIFSLVLVAVLVAVWTIPTLTAFLATGVVIYLAVVFHKSVLALSALNARDHGSVPPALLSDEELPTYTVLVPLYQEGNVVATLLDNLAALDYPAHKRQVLLLVEESDRETRAVIEGLALAENMHLLICPEGEPRTKPRACNVGLAAATGELLVIYDAEDRPERDQLRLAASTFAQQGSLSGSLTDRVPPAGAVICLQARLDYDNSDTNWLTRWFTVEYNTWFGLYLPALSRQQAPIPLGGTSNHFQTAALLELGGWDAYNVTEDADLGVRLFTRGWRTALLDSVTWEEACAEPGAWLRQRTRWFKGYAQTSLVHTRSLRWVSASPHPIRSLGAFAAFVPGTLFVALTTPVYQALFVLFALTRLELITTLIPPPWLWLGVIAALGGNAALIYVNVIEVERRGRWHLTAAAVTFPVYCLGLSVAAYRALAQLVMDPHRWEKTPHGLSARPSTAQAAPPATSVPTTPPAAPPLSAAAEPLTVAYPSTPPTRRGSTATSLGTSLPAGSNSDESETAFLPTAAAPGRMPRSAASASGTAPTKRAAPARAPRAPKSTPHAKPATAAPKTPRAKASPSNTATKTATTKTATTRLSGSKPPRPRSTPPKSTSGPQQAKITPSTSPSATSTASRRTTKETAAPGSPPAKRARARAGASKGGDS